MKKGDIGVDISRLQTLLNMAGFKIEKTAVFDQATEDVVIAFQRRAGLVADGIAGDKTMVALISREKNKQHLTESAIEQAADRLGVEIASIKAINLVESAGAGFLNDGRPVILYERHIAFRLLGEEGMAYDDSLKLAGQYPNLINQQRGGYSGKSGEWSRLRSACQIISPAIAQAACSWGAFQIMGYHWQHLGYESIDQFVAEMSENEGLQLAAFIRFIESEPALVKSLKAKKWADFARLYNGPAYRENLYDTKLARAYERFAKESNA